MADEEKSESTGGSIKNIIIGLVSTITLAVGGFITNKLTGGDEKETPAAAAPIINIQNNQTQQAGKTVIVNGGGGTDTGSLVTTASFNAYTASINSFTASSATSASNALVTASVSSNVVTFTKGNGTTFNLTVGSVVDSGSLATTAS